MDSDQRTRPDRQPDSSEASGSVVRLDPAERRRRVAEAREFARRTKSDPRETALLNEIEALQADNSMP